MVTRRPKGTTIVLVLVFVAILSVGLLAVVPVWETQVRREAEEELIFRGTQFVEAVRLFQKKNPGQLPASLEELFKKRFLRRLYKDPMTRDGKWDIVLQNDRMAPRGPGSGAAAARPPSQILVIAEESLGAVGTPRIIGVVSRSTRTGIRIYNDEDAYNRWFFYYGYDPKSPPEVVYHDQRDKK